MAETRSSMLSIEEVMEQLRYAASFEPRKLHDVGKINDFTSGPFFDKIQRKLKKYGKNIHFEELVYFRIEIDGLTGNQLLREMINIVNNNDIFRTGNCILFSLNNEYCAALMVFHLYYVSFITPTPANARDFRVFSQIFNEQYTASKSRVIASRRREESRGTFPKFLQEKISFTPLPIRYAFLGIIHDIALTEKRSQSNQLKNACHYKIPVAACIKLAIDSNQIGKLQEISGGPGTYPINSWRRDYLELCRRLNKQQPTEEALRQYLIDKTVYARTNASKKLVSKAFETDQHGNYSVFEIEEKVAEIKALFEIDNFGT